MLLRFVCLICHQLCVPDEPAEGVPGAITVAFRLPSGGRLSRRFDSSGTVASMQAFVLQQLVARGEARQHQRVVLSMQFPTKVLDTADSQIDAAGVHDRSMLSVQLA